MSCDAAALALSLHLASWRPDQGAPRLVRAASAAAPPVSPLAREPLFASIVGKAGRLRGEVEGWRRRAATGWSWSAADLDRLKAQASELAALDMQGHLELARRGTDGDLKCILRGLSQDIPRRLDELAAARDPLGRKSALDELGYLLRDNVEVVTTPATTSSEAVAG
jgi:hypothetical protein